MAIEICFISPYPELTRAIEEILPSLPEKVLLEEGAIEQAEPIIEKVEKQGVEVIITTEGNVRHLRKVFDIPLIAIPVSVFDTVFALNQAKKLFGEPLALFEFRSPNPRFHEIKEVIDVKMEQFVYLNEQDGLAKLKEAQKRGFKAAVSGGVIARMARSQGYPCIPIIPITVGKDAIIKAYSHAKEVAWARQKERRDAFKLKAIVDYSFEGIITVNAQNIITVFNPIAEKILEMKANEVIGKPMDYIVSANRIQPHIIETDKICNFKTKQVLVNKVPIYDHGQIVGSIFAFHEVNRIQSMEEKIRRANHENKLYAIYHFENIIGKSRIFFETIRQAKKYAHTDETVLITGETGTGKELFAQSIHNESSRSSHSFVAVNCAALSPALLESELFGYAEGAFTGAKKGGKKGLFELAHRGSILLDEIGEISLDVQSKLLRVLQQREVMRIGDNKLIPVDVRVISATNRDLLKDVEQGKFRRDLYYRLNILKLIVPPLRERKEDILPLAFYLLRNTTNGESVSLLEETLTEHRDLFEGYEWPGNVRELENLIKRLSVFADPDSTVKSLGNHIKKILTDFKGETKERENGFMQIEVNDGLKKTMERIENQLITEEYVRLKGDKTKLAQRLGIGRTTLWRKLHEAGIEADIKRP
ncbi:MAG: sigma 54-interacting transcriptional regulator [Bacillota bacterium]|nr:sigma 54-interacting transcriptional regulator [Bacillota bacterium]